MNFAPNCLLCCVITLVFWNWILRTCRIQSYRSDSNQGTFRFGWH